MLPLTRPWAWALVVIGVIGAPFAIGNAMGSPNGYSYISVAFSFAFIAIGAYRVVRPMASR
jgi:hypothetical protein